jgi:hypothetical protein
MEWMIAYKRYAFHYNIVSRLNLSQKRTPLLERVQSVDGDPLGLTEREFSDALPGEEVCSNLHTNGPGDTARGHDNANKPPTGVEVRTIKAAQELFMSNSFKLQVWFILYLCLVLSYD